MVLAGVCFVGLVWVLGDWGDFCRGVHKKGRAVLCCAGDLVILGVHLPCGKGFGWGVFGWVLVDWGTVTEVWCA